MKLAKVIIATTLEFLAVGSVTYGAWLAWHPLGFILGGAVVLLISHVLGGTPKGTGKE